MKDGIAAWGVAAPLDGVVPRQATQAKLDARAAAAAGIRPGDLYTIADRIEQRARDLGNRPFLVYGDQCFSYAEVDARANQVAHALLAHGVRPGAVCAMALENRPEFFFTWFGILKIGAVAAFLNTHVSGRALVHALESVSAQAVVLGEECLGNFAATEGVPALPRLFLPDPEKAAGAAPRAAHDLAFSQAVAQAPRSAPDRELRAGMAATERASLVFTSGTTGLPKAAIYSHIRWMMAGDVMAVTVGATPEDVFYCCLPLYHGAASLSVTSTALSAGSAIVLRRKFSVKAFWKDIRQYRVTCCQYIGEICRYLTNQPADPADRDHSLRCMVGAGFTAETWKRWVERFGEMEIFEGWGSTESNTNLINLDNYPGSVGRIPYWEKTNFRLVRYDVERETHPRDENGFCILCEPGEVGEGLGRIIDNPNFYGGRFEGYTAPDATEKKILRDVFEKGDAYWSSGDLLRYDENGYFCFIDRIGDTYRWKSENVSTLEVSEALSDYRDAELINIYGVQVPGHEGRAGMAAIVMQPGREFDPQAFYAVCDANLPRYAAPLFVRVPGLADLTSTYKLRKVDLQAQGYDPDAFDDPLFVRDERAATFRPYSAAVLEEVGLPPFRAALA